MENRGEKYVSRNVYATRRTSVFLSMVKMTNDVAILADFEKLLAGSFCSRNFTRLNFLVFDKVRRRVLIAAKMKRTWRLVTGKIQNVSIIRASIRQCHI